MLDVVLSTIVAVLNGMIWYSSSIGFGRVWAANAWPGKTLQEIGSDQSEGIYVVCILSHLVIMVLFKLLSREVRPLSMMEHMSLAVILSLMSLAMRTVHLPFESVPLAVILIDTGYDAVNLILSAVIQFTLRK